ncbi:ribosomal protein S18-alanine N-acetyltransferase [Anaerocolumna sp. AGMB13020]|uniref:ribosomal protein S18-alanine N-acetyltransferase n=1 Tax=Anaerocolumna sp. AGMB13020 TaxID=3081750 RepID=UPI0029547A12|nr:ribosomal protein S18-alanine N-acetyltransferase [Anaerocolumna sp. AGMB13020]WOO38824.1 ribosomal protein S18-alanine N-acetyltransferase [Anaerocolumna sp. AGMB13020]
MLIRHMQEEDMDQVYAIECNSFSRPWSRDSFLQSLRNPSNLYLVVEEEGRILGYCGLWGIVGEGEITNVAVDSEYRHRGVGEAMLRELLRQAGETGIETFTLEVRISNISAIHLYHKLGFQDTAIRKNYYDAPVEDALIMWL